MAEKMPLRVHVKGKRKAPLPPTPSALATNWKFDNNKTSVHVNDAERHKRDTVRTSCAPINLSCAGVLKRKKAFAPRPPSVYGECSTEPNGMNNLSAVSNRPTDKSSATATTNLNIFDATNGIIHENAKKELNLTTNLTAIATPIRHIDFDSNANRVPNHFEAVAQANRNNEIWICTNCTLQNPFWKIVCDACERIKPYNTPNVQLTNGFQLNDVENRPNVNVMDGTNLVISVKMRPKMNKATGDKVLLQRNSMQPDFQYHQRNQCRQPEPMEQIVTNKRTSLYANNVTANDKYALEMEKERIRHLIRSLNNRALVAQTRPTVTTSPTTIATPNLDRSNHRFWMPNKAKVINKNANAKQPTSTKHAKPPYHMNNDYRFPTKSTVNDANRRVVNETADQLDVLVQINKKLDRPNKGDKYYECVDDLKRAIEPIRTNGEPHALTVAHESFAMADELNDAMTPMNGGDGSLENNAENKMSLNVFINFNKAVQVTVPHNITLNKFKSHVIKTIAPQARYLKIYFNGLQLQQDEQTLLNYGIIDRSTIYVNTENVIAHTKSSPNPITPKSIRPVQTKATITITTAPTHNVAHRTEQNPAQTDGINQSAAIDLNIPSNNRRVPIGNTATVDVAAAAAAVPTAEHIQLNRFTIEKFHPKNENITRTKYRGVYNYNPRCNPRVFDEIKPLRVPMMVNDVLQPQPQPLPLPSSSSLPPSAATNANPKENLPDLNGNAISEYIELLTLDDSMTLTKNTEPFECPICLVDYEAFDGIILRNCLHTFCTECVRNSIRHSDGAEVKCPYIDNEYSCEYLLQDREIKGILDKRDYDEHLAKSLRIAEHQIENSFHCRTPNCKGWCIYEDDVNTFKCPICHLVNCLTCRVIHDGLDCKQYQNMMKNNADNNPENERTIAMLNEMVEKGEAMHCPACRVILMKKWGCDWLKCSMCKTEICWVTRNYRWGPAGKGDTSGGCKCGVDGFKCHPKCNYCH